jgi:hypothetical protein
VEHPDTLTSVCHLAFLFHQKRDYSAAVGLYQRAYDGYVKMLGVQHPSAIACFRHYESALQNRDLYFHRNPKASRSYDLVGVAYPEKKETDSLSCRAVSWTSSLLSMQLSSSQLFISLLNSISQSARPLSNQTTLFSYALRSLLDT